MRVYGALMWSLGKVISTPEVVRVYIGSFWDQPFLHSENRALFEAESADLFEDLQSLPRNAALRKLNDLIKRARLAKVRVFLINKTKNLIKIILKKYCVGARVYHRSPARQHAFDVRQRKGKGEIDRQPFADVRRTLQSTRDLSRGLSRRAQNARDVERLRFFQISIPERKLLEKGLIWKFRECSSVNYWFTLCLIKIA